MGYADDTLILTRATDIQEGITRANLQISKTLKRIRQLELQVAEAKTKIVIFRNRKKKIPERLYVRVGREMVPVKKSIKYLGMDQGWTFRDHAEYIEKVNKSGATTWQAHAQFKRPYREKA